MLFGNQQQSAYSNVQVQANASVSSSFELIYMLHERLELELDVFIFAIDNKDYEKKSAAAQKIIDILTGLDSSLDLDNPNELIVNIHNLYEYSIGVVFQASKDMNSKLIEDLKQPLTDLKDGWKGAMAFLN